MAAEAPVLYAQLFKGGGVLLAPATSSPDSETSNLYLRHPVHLAYLVN